MFNKIKWKEHKFYYTFDANEPVFNADYFQFYNGNARGDNDGNNVQPEDCKLDYQIKVISNNQLMVSGPFYNGYYVVINNIPYPYYEEEEPEIPENPDSDKPSFDIPSGIYKIINEDETLYFDKLPQDYITNYLKVDIEIDEYTNEVYPDYPFRSTKHKLELNKFHKTKIIQMQKNVIYQIKIYIDNRVKFKEEFKAKILSYFSTVNGLKTYIEDLQLNIPMKSDEELKKLIQENSVKLKRRFGLKDKYTEDPEYLPIFKEVVNLYCLEDLISVSFINGNFITSGEKGTVSGLKLSKFEVDGEGGDGGYILSTDLINNLIKEAENNLYASLHKDPVNKKKKGMQFRCYQQSSLRKILI